MLSRYATLSQCVLACSHTSKSTQKIGPAELCNTTRHSSTAARRYTIKDCVCRRVRMGEGAVCLWLAFQTSSLHKITSWEDNLWACDNLFRLTFLQSVKAVEGKCRRPKSVCRLLLPRDTQLTASAATQKEKETPLHLICSSTFTTSIIASASCFFYPMLLFFSHHCPLFNLPIPLAAVKGCAVKLQGGYTVVGFASVWCSRGGFMVFWKSKQECSNWWPFSSSLNAFYRPFAVVWTWRRVIRVTINPVHLAWLAAKL